MKATAILMEAGLASGLADSVTETVMKLQCLKKSALQIKQLKIDGYFLWHGSPSLQQFAASAFQLSVLTHRARFPHVTD